MELTRFLFGKEHMLNLTTGSIGIQFCAHPDRSAEFGKVSH